MTQGTTNVLEETTHKVTLILPGTGASTHIVATWRLVTFKRAVVGHTSAYGAASADAMNAANSAESTIENRS